MPSVCPRVAPVLPFAAHCICFRSNVSIIPQQARVCGLLTHARAVDRPSRCRPEPHLFLSLQCRRVGGPTPYSTQTHCMDTWRLTCTVSVCEWPLEPVCCKHCLLMIPFTACMLSRSEGGVGGGDKCIWCMCQVSEKWIWTGHENRPMSLTRHRKCHLIHLKR